MTPQKYMYARKPHLNKSYNSKTNATRYRTAIVPIGVLFSFSLIFGNVAYMYLSVSFIQMLKVASTAPEESCCS